MNNNELFEHYSLYGCNQGIVSTSIKNRNNSFSFKIPDAVNSTIYQTAEAFKKQNNLKNNVSQSTIDIIMEPNF
jgi:hypothetical protein